MTSLKSLWFVFSAEEQKGGTPAFWSEQNGEDVNAGGCKAQEMCSKLALTGSKLVLRVTQGL